MHIPLRRRGMCTVPGDAVATSYSNRPHPRVQVITMKCIMFMALGLGSHVYITACRLELGLYPVPGTGRLACNKIIECVDSAAVGRRRQRTI